MSASRELADVTWHVFRHTYISRLVMAGVDLRTVQELAGHKDISMTTRYAHLSPDHKLNAVAKLSAFREQSETSASKLKDHLALEGAFINEQTIQTETGMRSF
jgi:site-specific recombinase XerD